MPLNSKCKVSATLQPPFILDDLTYTFATTAPSVKKTNVDTAKLAAAKKRKKATAVIAPKKGKKPVPKAAPVASTKSGTHEYELVTCAFDCEPICLFVV